MILKRARQVKKMVDRVLVHVQKSKDVQPVKLKFSESLVESLGSKDDIVGTYNRLEGNKFIISGVKCTEQDVFARLKRPCFCPIHNMKKEDISRLSPKTSDRGTDVGCAVLVESTDGKILLTRRAKTLRIFPGVWVPPGGHVEQGETLEEAGLRELCEETGLQVNSEMCSLGEVQTIALWESVYPPSLDWGLPRRHHCVIYLHAKLKDPHTSDSMNKLLKLEPAETDASAWLDRRLIEAIVARSEEAPDSYQEDSADVPQTFRATVLGENGQQKAADLPTSIMLNVMAGQDTERVSTGTKHALHEWVIHTQT